MGRRRAAQIDADFWRGLIEATARADLSSEVDATLHPGMSRLLIMGNSGSGKSTLAARLANRDGLSHLDLDTLAWEVGSPPRRRALDESCKQIAAFIEAKGSWVIEGCYADLLEPCLPHCTRLVFLNPGVEACIANARARPWEPHKYPSKQTQDANLEMLIAWIRDYETRADVFSLQTHRALYNGFRGAKTELKSLPEIAAL
jgi:adenylate kinase family enzyme